MWAESCGTGYSETFCSSGDDLTSFKNSLSSGRLTPRSLNARLRSTKLGSLRLSNEVCVHVVCMCVCEEDIISTHAYIFKCNNCII